MIATLSFYFIFAELKPLYQTKLKLNMKTNMSLLLTALLLLCSLLPASAVSLPALLPAAENEFEILMEKIRSDFNKNPNIENSLQLFDEATGAFTDIDYANTQMTKWKPLAHVERLQDFAWAYTNPQNKHYQEDALFDKIQKGLEYWHNVNPECDNWWYNQIAEPQRLGILLIQMRIGKKKLPAELEQKILNRIKEDGGEPDKWTGANRTDIALHWIYRSCLSADAKDLTFALENVYSPVVYTTEEGFQYDNSNFQHGPQLYIGGYGDEILKGVTQVAMYTIGTRFAMPQEKIDLISKFMRETYYPSIRGQYMLYDVMGRSVSRPNMTKKTSTALYAQRMVELDPAHADEFKAIIKRLKGEQPANYAIKPAHTHYYRADYTLHVRPNYTFDVRLVSNRTSRCEYGNKENLKTYFMSDGCNNIVQSGKEYTNIFPVWNWARIPGVTAPQLEEIPLAKKAWQTLGSSTFAGGVSDSLYGMTAYAYMDKHAGINTSAHKAWFFFDDEIVCLGADIQSTSPAEICTTINQCLSQNQPVTICQDGQTTEMKENCQKLSSPKWILHNQVGYIFPAGGEIFASNQRQKGAWYDINRSGSKNIQSQKVFTLGFEHGTNPTGATYAYIIVPGQENAEALNNYIKQGNISILSNDKNIQAVNHKRLGIWQMVFYQAGEFKDKDIRVQTDTPCALMVKQIGKKEAVLHIADVAQNQSRITVHISMPGSSKKSQTIECDFSTDDYIYAGITKSYKIKF